MPVQQSSTPLPWQSGHGEVTNLGSDTHPVPLHFGHFIGWLLHHNLLHGARIVGAVADGSAWAVGAVGVRKAVPFVSVLDEDGLKATRSLANCTAWAVMAVREAWDKRHNVRHGEPL